MAAAANYYSWGADSISFWNVGIHFGSESTATPEQQERIARWTQAVTSEETVRAGPRTYRNLPMGKCMSIRSPPSRSLKHRESMTDDVNAAIDGCFAAGATEVAVKDDGYREQNLHPKRLDTTVHIAF